MHTKGTGQPSTIFGMVGPFSEVCLSVLDAKAAGSNQLQANQPANPASDCPGTRDIAQGELTDFGHGQAMCQGCGAQDQFKPPHSPEMILG